MLRELFSIRYKPGLDSEKIKIWLDGRLKHRLCSVIRNYDESFEAWDDWGQNNYYTSYSEHAFKDTQNCLGQNELYTYHGKDDRRVAGRLEDVVNNGWPPNALDCLEAMYWSIPEERRVAFCEELNTAFEISDSSLRLMAGAFIKVDSSWLTRQVLSKANGLLSAAGFGGPLEEFRKAVKAHQARNTKDAIYFANLALESTEKAILGVKRGKPGWLLSQIADSGLVPEYCQGFVKCFEQFFASVSGIRNNTPGAGHGQGAIEESVPPEVSELMLHATGSIIVFLLKLHLQQQNNAAPLPAKEGAKKTA